MLISIPRGGRQEPALMKVVLLYRRFTAPRKKPRTMPGFHARCSAANSTLVDESR